MICLRVIYICLYFHTSIIQIISQISGEISNSKNGKIIMGMLIISWKLLFNQINSRKNKDTINILDAKKNNLVIQKYIFLKTYFHFFITFFFIKNPLSSRILCSSCVSSIHRKVKNRIHRFKNKFIPLSPTTSYRYSYPPSWEMMSCRQ
jgi:hypothetical protein